MFINTHPLEDVSLTLQAHHEEFHTLIKFSHTFQYQLEFCKGNKVL